jgi:hypothetical protein
MLVEMGLDPIPVAEASFEWSLKFQYPVGLPANTMGVLKPKTPARALLVVTGVHLVAQHHAAFANLDQDDQKRFAFGLQKALLRDYVDYSIQGISPQALTCPTGFQITSTIYDDGLTLTNLALRISSVFKAQLAGNNCVNEFLGPLEGTGGSGTFAFRRLGGAIQ